MAYYKEKAAKKRAINKEKFARSSKAGREAVFERTYGNFDTTVFDVRRDFIQMYNDKKYGGSLTPKFANGQIRGMRLIVHELRQRMASANRTLPQALGDLEEARRKLRVKGKTGTVACLVAAIKSKNGKISFSGGTPIFLEY